MLCESNGHVHRDPCALVLTVPALYLFVDTFLHFFFEHTRAL